MIPPLLPNDGLPMMSLDVLQMRRLYIHQAMIVYEQSFVVGALGDPGTPRALQMEAYNRYVGLRNMLEQIDSEIMTRFVDRVGNIFN